MLVRGAGVRPRSAGCRGSPSSDSGGCGEPSEVMSLPLLFPLLDFSSFSCPCLIYEDGEVSAAYLSFLPSFRP